MNMNDFEEWIQNLSQQDMLEASAFDFPLFDATANVKCDTILSRRLSGINVASLAPKDSINVKTTRRRSRASKRSPTMLLSANPDNFRSLVQKFTGCNTSSNLLGTRKGPIILSFSKYNSSFTQQSINRSNYTMELAGSIAEDETTMNSLFVPSEVASARPEQLIVDDLDMMLQELSEPGNYPYFW